MSAALRLRSMRAVTRRYLGALRRCGRSARRVPAGLRVFAGLPGIERRMTLRALATLVFVEATIRWMRLPRLAARLGIVLRPDEDDGPTATQQAPESALQVEVACARRCTYRLMAVWPLGAGPCLRESLVLGHLIRNRSPHLRLGVARYGPKIRAHAWIELDGLAVNDPQGFLAFGSRGRP